MSKLLKGTFVELSNLRRKKAMSLSLTVGLLTVSFVNKNQFRSNLNVQLLDLKKIQFGIQKLLLTPPLLLLKGLCRYYAGKKRETEKF